MQEAKYSFISIFLFFLKLLKHAQKLIKSRDTKMLLALEHKKVQTAFQKVGFT
jgi:hypothetical protein